MQTVLSASRSVDVDHAVIVLCSLEREARYELRGCLDMRESTLCAGSRTADWLRFSAQRLPAVQARLGARGFSADLWSF